MSILRGGVVSWPDQPRRPAWWRRAAYAVYVDACIFSAVLVHLLLVVLDPRRWR